MTYSTGFELILNACEGVLQVAITENEALRASHAYVVPRGATDILAPIIQESCHLLHMHSRDFRRIACVKGPGSFTGIRLVLATAAAMRRASKAQLAGLDYLQALATTAVLERGLLYGSHVWVLTHARRQLLHVQHYTSFGPQIPAQAAREVALLSPEEACAQIAKRPGYLCGSGLGRYPDIFKEQQTGTGPAFAPEAILLPQLVTPSFAALCLLARHGDYAFADIEPNYVRPVDAVDNLGRLAARQGLTPEEAHQRLRELLTAPPKNLLESE